MGAIRGKLRSKAVAALPSDASVLLSVLLQCRFTASPGDGLAPKVRVLFSISFVHFFHTLKKHKRKGGSTH
jgi:hypothetical protein